MSETSVANTLRRPRAPAQDRARPPRRRARQPPSRCRLRLDTSYLETLLGYNARRAALAVIGVFLQRMAPYGLRPVDFSVLTLIAHNPGVTSRQLCAALDILPPNLVGMIKSLDKRGLIERRPTPPTGAPRACTCRPPARSCRRAPRPPRPSWKAMWPAALTPQELDTLKTLLRKVYRG